MSKINTDKHCCCSNWLDSNVSCRFLAIFQVLLTNWINFVLILINESQIYIFSFQRRFQNNEAVMMNKMRYKPKVQMKKRMEKEEAKFSIDQVRIYYKDIFHKISSLSFQNLSHTQPRRTRKALIILLVQLEASLLTDPFLVVIVEAAAKFQEITLPIHIIEI